MKKRTLIMIIVLFILSLGISCKKKENDDDKNNNNNTPHVHTFGEWEEVVPMECYSDGVMERKCECGESEIKVIPASHTWSKATCMVRAVCQVCGEKGDYAEHAYSEWDILKEPTCTSTGIREHKCAYCGKVESQSIDALSHDFSEWVILQNPTCVSEGLREHTCSVGNEVVREKIPMVDHNYSEWENLTEATCTVEGIRIHHCTDCGKEEVETIPCIDHNYSAWEVVEEASCNHPGIEKHICTMCDETEERIIEKGDHQFEMQNGEMVCTICHTKESAHSVISKVINELRLSVDKNSSDGLVLPEEIDGVTIIWRSLTPDVVTNDGTIYASRSIQQAIVVGKFSYLDATEESSFEVEIPVMDVSTHNYCWNIYYSKKVLDSTASNLSFINKPYGDCKVLGYESSNPEIITSKGEITQKMYNQSASISCYIQYGKVINKYTKTVIVLPYTDTQIVEIVADWIPTVVDQLQKGEVSELPYTDESFGTTITWFCMNPGVIAGNGIFVKPLTPMDLELKCTVVYKNRNRQLTFNLTNIGGNMTKKEQLREWIKGQIPMKIMGTKNFVLANDELDYQIRTNSYGILNLIDGSSPIVDRSMLIDVNKTTWVNRYWGSSRFGTYHPIVTQDILNEMMYEGYKQPNEQNILWITIHESGMPRSGNNAKLLAQVQMDTATGKRDRQASWNYQVDENKIYQSFEDEVICWHAGDGTATLGNGNNNSIGIEMCINEDGSYDGSMYHDAKLVAMLLHKYNLSLVNVKRHFDWSGKICPNYMITQGRWYEYLSLVDKEYTAMDLLKDAKVTWTVTTDDMSNTNEVLDKYFTKGASTIYISKPVEKEVVLHITMQVEYDGEIMSHSSDLTLYPEK